MLRLLVCQPVLFRSARSVALVFVASSLTASGELLYDTGFETTDTPPFAAGVGTIITPKLVSLSGTPWAMAVSPSTTVPVASCYPFAGIDSALVSGMGQTAALGCLDHVSYTMPPTLTQFIRVGHKVDKDPVVTGGKPIVDFYCQIGLTQSTNGHHDDFEVLVYNFDDKVLGGLTFDLTENKLFRYDANEYSSGYVAGVSASPFTDTGLSLSPLYGKVQELRMRVNYNTNTWSASVGGVQVVNNAIFTKRPVASAARTFGSTQARWYISVPGFAGNNWMLFDDWIISAYAEPTIPVTVSAAYGASSTASIVVTDEESAGWTIASDQTWAVVSPSTGTGTATVTVTCAVNSGLARSATITSGGQTCVLAQAGAPYALWAATLPPGQQEFYQDADGDNIVNGVEYALGRSATSAVSDNGAAQLPVFAWTGSGASLRPALALNLSATEAADATYSVQAANDLSGVWTVIMEKTGSNPWAAVGSSGASVTSIAAETGRILHTVTDAQAHQFLRLKVTKAP